MAYIAKIYKLVNTVDGATYIGATKLPLKQRLSLHKSNSINSPNRRVYAHARDIGWGNIRIELVEDFACSNRSELSARERHWIHALKPSLNTIAHTLVSPERVAKQQKYYMDNRAKILIERGNYQASLRAAARLRAVAH